MFENKHLNLGYISAAFIIFGIAIGVSFAKAESSLESNIDSSQSYIIKKIAASEEDAPAQETIEEGELEEFEIIIEGMTSVDCENAVKEELLKCSGVENAWANYEQGKAVIEANPGIIDSNEIKAAVEKAGFSLVEEE